jgi:hypothetical protein
MYPMQVWSLVELVDLLTQVTMQVAIAQNTAVAIDTARKEIDMMVACVRATPVRQQIITIVEGGDA